MIVIAVLLVWQAIAIAHVANNDDNGRGERIWAWLLVVVDVAAAVHLAL